MTIKGIDEVVKASQKCEPSRLKTWLDIYYDFGTQTVSTERTNSNWAVTQLIRPNTAEEIEDTIKRWARV